MWNENKTLHKFVEWDNFLLCNDCFKFNFFKHIYNDY